VSLCKVYKVLKWSPSAYKQHWTGQSTITVLACDSSSGILYLSSRDDRIRSSVIACRAALFWKQESL